MRKMITISLVLVCSLISGCMFRPYVPEVQQGNIISQAKVSQLKIGMDKEEVRYIIGDPILVDVFNKDIWTYVSTDRKNGKLIQKKRLTLYFKNNRLVKIDAWPNPIPKPI